MIDLAIGAELDARLADVRRLGREHLRPLGIEADRNDAPVPPDHPFFATAWHMGLGQPLGVEDRAATRGPRTAARRGVVVAEEMAYWDRGMSVAMPGSASAARRSSGWARPSRRSASSHRSTIESARTGRRSR